MKLSESTYVDVAEQIIKKLADNSKTDRSGNPIMVTTSKIRNILAMTMDIYNQVQNQKEDELSEEIKGRIEYLRVRVIYECGRDEMVKSFVKQAGLLELLKGINGSRKRYLLFTHYMEALVAFRKYQGNDKEM